MVISRERLMKLLIEKPKIRPYVSSAPSCDGE